MWLKYVLIWRDEHNNETFNIGLCFAARTWNWQQICTKRFCLNVCVSLRLIYISLEKNMFQTCIPVVNDDDDDDDDKRLFKT